jgi:glycosyltransferase involved in cell wall biosynthesis
MVSSAESQKALDNDFKLKKSRYILYTGSLEERYGLGELLEAFSLAGIEDCDLVICGDGNYREEIIKMGRVNEKIKYLGSLPRERALDLQRDATLLVNPRPSSGDFTKFSFPSKTMEYLLSGTPVLMRPLPGLIPEFEDLVFLDSEQTVQSLSAKMREILDLAPEIIKEKTEKAIKYLAETKTEIVQTADFCHEIDQ